MLAEVRSQSADDLVDGVSAAEERKYSYSHYYGNRWGNVTKEKQNLSSFFLWWNLKPVKDVKVFLLAVC